MMMEIEEDSNLNTINENNENYIKKVFNIELLSHLIASFLERKEKKEFYSVNKKINCFFRNTIKEIKSQKILKSPEIIERFPYLKKIEICGRKSVDFNFLKKKELKNLENLKLKEVSVRDTSTLSGLTNLKTLNLITNKITDISFIKNFPKLSILGIGNNKIQDLSYLVNLSCLKSLSLQQCGLTDLQILNHNNFKNLEKLFIGNNFITNYSFLQNLQNLNTLNLYHNNLNSIEFLFKLNKDKMIDLNIGENKINDYSPLLQFPNLIKLNLYNNNLYNINFLNENEICFQKLESIDIGNNKDIKDFIPLTKLKKLKKINLFNCKLYDIYFLLKENYESFEYIELGNNKEIDDFSILSFFNNLQYLSLDSDCLTDMSWLNYCEFGNSLIELDLGNIIKNAYVPDVLKKFTNLKILNLSKWMLNISFLNWDSFSHLEKLNLSYNQKMHLLLVL